MILGGDLKGGVVLRYEGVLYKVVFSEYHAGGGKMGGAVHAKLKNVLTGTPWEHRFRPDEKLDDVALDRVTLEYLYQDGDDFIFMNPESFEQLPVSKNVIGPVDQFLKAEMRLPVEFYEGRPVNIVFPQSVELKVVTTAQPVHSQQDNVMKTATLENGMEILVPQFVKPGEGVRVEVETGKYLERVRHDDKKRF
jgi:elongation factor P